MGLFRRGTKLLKVGSSLRDCCCRPEQPPEECWCPDFCTHYWYWHGKQFLPAGSFVTDACSSEDGLTVSLGQPGFGNGTQTSYGMIDGSLQVYKSSVPNRGCFDGGVTYGSASIGGSADERGATFSYNLSVNGPLNLQAESDIFGSNSEWSGCLGVGNASYSVTCVAAVSCTLVNSIPTFVFTASRRIEIRAAQVIDYRFNADFIPVEAIYTTRIIYRDTQWLGSNLIPVSLEAACESRSDLDCNGSNLRKRRIKEEVEVSVSEAGATINGTTYPWVFLSTTSGLPVDNRHLTSLWNNNVQDPTEFTATLKLKPNCGPLVPPCDCTVSLTDRTVLFEGKEMTYGQLDNFYFPGNPGDPYSGTWWAEDPVGTFTRRDVENCDGSLNQRVKVVEIDCINEGGVDKWVAYLDHTCNERDDLTCPGPADAQRVKQWTGFFLCDENGSPTGSPTELEVDYDVTSGTPAAECVDALQPPSFEFL